MAGMAAQPEGAPTRRVRAWAWLAVALLALMPAACGSAGAQPRTAATRRATPVPTLTPTPSQSLAATLPVLPPPPAISARVAYLVNPQTGRVYLALDADQEVAMASTTKIMTAVVALTYGSLDERISVGANATALDNTGASVAGLREGDSLTLRELLYALLLPSGDDAAVVIADGVLGSQARFVQAMNAEAWLLGLYHTHYANVHGLDAPQHFTTARDLARLTEYAMRLPAFAQVVGTPSYTLPATANHHAYTWTTTNELFSLVPTPGVTGVKTGYTGNAGYCLVFTVTRPSGTLLGVLLGEPTYQARFTDAHALLSWGYQVQGYTIVP
jgi:D-alanyl-D-alanine carboxypeptidase (penicillin-binding protein 5/6)